MEGMRNTLDRLKIAAEADTLTTDSTSKESE
jgi:hypothetical protein